jgi:hypothetical protein
VGNWSFAPDNLASPSTVAALSPDYLGFSEDVASYNHVVFSANATSITHQRYPSSWTTPTGNNITVASDGGSYGLQAVYYDPLGTVNQEVALVFFDSSYNRVRVFLTPRASYSTPPLSTLEAYPSLQFEDVSPERVMYTRKGMVLVEDRAATLTDFNGNPTNKRLTLGERENARLAFDVEGEVFFVFDEENRTLYRGKTGW